MARTSRTPRKPPRPAALQRAIRVALLGAGIAAGTWVLPTPGRVYLRAPGYEPGQPPLEHLGWSKAHTTTLQLGGGEAEVTVAQSDRDVGATLAQLEAAFRDRGGSVFVTGSDEMGWGIMEREGRVVRWLVFTLRARGPAMVLWLDQSASAFKRSTNAGGDPAVDLPRYPGAVTTYACRDPGSGLGVEVARVPANPGTVARHLDAALARAGWHPTGPPTGGQGVYTRGREVCSVAVKSTGVPGESVITYLHKRGRNTPLVETRR